MKVVTWLGEYDFSLDEIPDPVPRKDEVVVKIDTAGICGTELHLIQGLFPGNPPKILGHEYSGQVIQVGDPSFEYLLGKNVACQAFLKCKKCRACKNSGSCTGRKSFGGFSQKIAMPSQLVHILPKGLSLENASLTEPAACSLSGLRKVGISPGKTILIIGAGVIGLLTAGISKLMGAEKIIVSDPIKMRREKAKQVGADFTLDPNKYNLGEFINDLTDGLGVDIACEATGIPKLVEDIFYLIKEKGVLQLAGVGPEGTNVPIDLFKLHNREISIQGAFGMGDCFTDALEILNNLNLDGFVNNFFSLSEVEKAFKKAEKYQSIKTSIKPNM